MLDEVFLAYSPEVVHRDLFVSQLLTIVVLCVLLFAAIYGQFLPRPGWS